LRFEKFLNRHGNCVTTLKVKFKSKESPKKNSMEDAMNFDIMEVFNEEKEN